MAFQTRGRDPLFDSNMQAAIERRGKELIGVVVFFLGLLATLAFVSYSPDDPSWMSVTEAPVQNWLGRLGASLSAPIFMILGMGGWGIAALGLVWGLRLGLHFGAERVLSRIVFAPIWIALLSLYAASLIPSDAWSHSFGLGGLFGDTVLGTLIGVAPVSASIGLKLLSLVLGLGSAALGLYVFGLTRREMARGFQIAVYGVIVAYIALTKLGSKAAQMAWRATLIAKDKLADHRARKRAEAAELAAIHAAEAAVPSPHQAAPEWSAESEPPATPNLRDRLTGIVRRAMPAAEAAAPAAHDAPEVNAWQEPEMPEPTRPAPTRPAPAITAPRMAAPAAQIDQPRAPQVSEPPLQRPAPQPALQPQPRLGGVTRPREEAEQPAYAATAQPTQHEPATAAPKAGLFSRLPNLMRRAEPETGPAPFAEVDDNGTALDGLPLDDRIKAKIADAVRQRARTSARLSAPTHQPLTRGRGRGPDPLILAQAPAALPPEPPLTPAEPAHQATPDPAPVVDSYHAAEETPLLLPEAAPVAVAPQMTLPQTAAEPQRRVVQPKTGRAPAPSARARAEAQPTLKFEDRVSDFELPPLNLLSDPANITRHHLSDDALEENARMLESVLDDYGVKGDIVSVRPGPVVTMYELEPAPGLKASRVIGLADDIARSMAALSARVSTVPGRSVIGIELPNDNREMVVLREILAARDFGDSNMKLPLALGKDIGGDPIVANLAKMPHLLIAGTTGSGKSVAINTMILSLLYKLTPDECRLIMIDPKMLELSVYDGIPHLLSPVVTDPKKAVVALKWVVGEMEERYRKMSKMGVRNIDGYNGRVADTLARGEMFSRTVQTGFDEDSGEPIFETEETQPEKMPYIVVIVDEMADLMMVAGKEIEACIQRLAQMARASGIHLIMATQRPSVDVITGTIKANFPTRISFQVTSKIDSRTILGEMGAEQLLGQGDMLYMAGGAKIVRCHGPFVSDEEVEEIVNHLKAYGPPDYIGGVVEGPDEETESDIDLVLGLGGNTGGDDALYDQAVAVVVRDRKCSTSYIQRKLGIGYNKAARLVEQMEDQGLVSAANHVGKREILVPEQQ
ncbi:DNA translocase FtsK 4TM domain-containing protein [Pseudooceanicola sp.]|uniref:DNA translocase FtsK n=1 Tax=Pseudooceanicola sp. TaxID=1914328 RepID=UPI0026301EBC|nr:DNA translocase FtsK 4TM domain-containing protein [Pseudooceanicola sp.]MDF1854593.1 DNA translocase FtsK 4TM domain-containing protein [Pseudooceanicola sp.]